MNWWWRQNDNDKVMMMTRRWWWQGDDDKVMMARWWWQGDDDKVMMTRLYEGTSASDTFDGRCVGHRLKVNFPPSWQKEFQICSLKMKTHLEISNCKRNQAILYCLLTIRSDFPFSICCQSLLCWAKSDKCLSHNIVLLGHVIYSFHFILKIPWLTTRQGSINCRILQFRIGNME